MITETIPELTEESIARIRAGKREHDEDWADDRGEFSEEFKKSRKAELQQAKNDGMTASRAWCRDFATYDDLARIHSAVRSKDGPFVRRRPDFSIAMFGLYMIVGHIAEAGVAELASELSGPTIDRLNEHEFLDGLLRAAADYLDAVLSHG
jgi:hypothetical protein